MCHCRFCLLAVPACAEGRQNIQGKPPGASMQCLCSWSQEHRGKVSPVSTLLQTKAAALLCAGVIAPFVTQQDIYPACRHYHFETTECRVGMKTLIVWGLNFMQTFMLKGCSKSLVIAQDSRCSTALTQQAKSLGSPESTASNALRKVCKLPHWQHTIVRLFKAGTRPC